MLLARAGMFVIFFRLLKPSTILMLLSGTKKVSSAGRMPAGAGATSWSVAPAFLSARASLGTAAPASLGAEPLVLLVSFGLLLASFELVRLAVLFLFDMGSSIRCEVVACTGRGA